MHRYELLILTTPEITSDETTAMEKEFEKTVQQGGGSIISFDRWGKLRLAYPINDKDYGIYFLTRLEVDDAKKDELLKTLDALFTLKYNELVMRFMTCKLDPNASLEYDRPEALEDVPTRDVGQFLRDNKMEGLLPKGGSEKTPAPEASDLAKATSDKPADKGLAAVSPETTA